MSACFAARECPDGLTSSNRRLLRLRNHANRRVWNTTHPKEVPVKKTLVGSSAIALFALSTFAGCSQAEDGAVDVDPIDARLHTQTDVRPPPAGDGTILDDPNMLRQLGIEVYEPTSNRPRTPPTLGPGGWYRNCDGDLWRQWLWYPHSQVLTYFDGNDWVTYRFPTRREIVIANVYRRARGLYALVCPIGQALGGIATETCSEYLIVEVAGPACVVGAAGASLALAATLTCPEPPRFDPMGQQGQDLCRVVARYIDSFEPFREACPIDITRLPQYEEAIGPFCECYPHDVRCGR